MANLKQIKVKIKSVSNLKKITRALEIVSTVKLQKLKHQAEWLKIYLTQVLRILWVASHEIDVFGQEKNTVEATSEKTAVILITSERWLCGGLNTKLLRKAIQENDLSQTDFFVVGKKWLETLKRVDASIVWYIQVGDSIKTSDLLSLYTFFEDATTKGTYKKILLYFNFFKNSIMQIPTEIQLYPFSLSEVQLFFQDIDMGKHGEFTTQDMHAILLEPSRSRIKEEIRRQMRNYVIISALAQNKTGEHASRMIAMKNAKDNATSFVSSLTLKYNKERQAAITKEISEIVSAKLAIEG